MKQAQKQEADQSYKQIHLGAFKEDEAAARESWESYKKSWSSCIDQCPA